MTVLLSDAPTDQGAVRLIEACRTRADAEASVRMYAAMLVRKGETERYGVFFKRIPGRQGFGVYVKDRQAVSSGSSKSS